jgi:hypothetical protein
MVNPSPERLPPTRKNFRYILYVASFLPGRNYFDIKKADHRLEALFGFRHDFADYDVGFLHKRLGRLYHKSFRYLAMLFCRFTKKKAIPARPVRVPPRDEVPHHVEGVFDSPLGAMEPVKVAAAVKGPLPLPWQANLPFFGVSKLPSEEPWWVQRTLPPSKRAFIEHLYCHDFDTLNLKPIENRDPVEHSMIGLALPGKGWVTICLSAYELQIFSQILANRDEDFNLITPLFTVELDGDFGRLLYPNRLHICSEPHGACDRSSIKSFIKDNPWPVWEGMLQTESASAKRYFDVKSSQFATVTESIPTASAGISS